MENCVHKLGTLFLYRTWSLYIAKHINSLNVQQPRYASPTKRKQKAPRIRVVSDHKKYDSVPPPSEIGTVL